MKEDGVFKSVFGGDVGQGDVRDWRREAADLHVELRMARASAVEAQRVSGERYGRVVDLEKALEECGVRLQNNAKSFETIMAENRSMALRLDQANANYEWLCEKYNKTIAEAASSDAEVVRLQGLLAPKRKAQKGGRK
jgi:hypothetical protein